MNFEECRRSGTLNSFIHIGGGLSLGLIRERIAIDLGTAYSIVAHEKSKNFWRVPSSIAFHALTRLPVAYGEAAKEMAGKGSEKINVVRPLRDGVICDFEAAGQYLTYLVNQARRNPLALQVSVLVCVPWGATPVETKSYKDRIENMRTHVRLIREPFAAALGCDLDVFSPEGCTVVDIGGGTVEISTIAYGHMIHCSSLRQAGNAMDQLIADRMLRTRQFEIGLTTAEEVKMARGSVASDPNIMEEAFEIFGLDRRSGFPRRTTITSEDIRGFLEPITQTIENKLIEHINVLPPEFRSQVESKGIYMVGGGALLRGWKIRLERDFGIKVNIPEDPQLAVIRGMQKVLKHRSRYKSLVKISESEMTN